MDFEFALKSAQTLMDKLELEDAEEMFNMLLINIRAEEKQRKFPSEDLKNLTMYQVECMVGIAECRSKSFKMGRYLKEDFWLQCFILPLCLLYKSQQLIRLSIDKNMSQRYRITGEHRIDMQTRFGRLNFLISSLETNFIRGFLRKVFNGNLEIKHSCSDFIISLNTKWIYDLGRLCKVADVNVWSKKKSSKVTQNMSPLETEMQASKDGREHLAVNSIEPIKGDVDQPLQQRIKTSQRLRQAKPTFLVYGINQSRLRDASPNPFNKNHTINFEKFQETIQGFVKEISGEVRSRYGHLRNLPESLIERRLASEIALRLTPGSIQAEDYINVLEEALVSNKTADKKADDISNAENLLDKQKLTELETERLLALDDQQEEDQNSCKTFYFDISGILQCKDCNDKSKQATGDALLLPTTSAEMTLAYIDNFKKNRFISGVQNLISLESSNKPECETFKRVRPGIVFLWRGSQTKPDNLESKETFLSKVRNNIRVLSLSENQFEELPSVNKSPTECKNEHVPRSENSEWPYQEIKKSDLLLLFLRLVVKAAKHDSMKDHRNESLELLEISDKIIKEHWNSTSLDDDDVRNVVSLIWYNLGEEFSKSGKVSKGSFYLEKQKALTSGPKSKSNDEISSIYEEVEKWCKMGDAYLGEDLRSESLLARLMQLTKQELVKRDVASDNENKISKQLMSGLFRDQSKNAHETQHIHDSDSEDDDRQYVYCTCLEEAVGCFSRAANILRNNCHKLSNNRPELWSEILTKVADCYLMSGNLGLAESAYDEALDHLSRALGSEHLQRNADAILALATLCFLTGNNTRASTLLLTSLALRGKYYGKGFKDIQVDFNNFSEYHCGFIKKHNSLDVEEGRMEFGTVWTLMVLSFAHDDLKKPYQAISWGSRALSAHGKFFHGRLVAVDSLNRWFLFRILISCARNHVVLSNPLESINRLTLAQKLLEISGNGDHIQLSQIFQIFGDAYILLSSGVGLTSELASSGDVLKTYAKKSDTYYHKALELLKQRPNDMMHHNKLQEKISYFKIHKRYNRDDKTDKFESPQLKIAWNKRKKNGDSMTAEVHNKIDLISILIEMANDHVLNYNLDQSIACFVESSRELDKLWMMQRKESDGFLLASIYFRLGRLFHVKHLLSSDQSDELQCYSDASIRVFDSARDIGEDLFTDEAEMLCLDILVAKSCLLYDLGKTFDAIQTSLSVFCKRNEGGVIFSGQEVFALPKHLRPIFGHCCFEPHVTIQRKYLLGLLATTCFREIGLIDYAIEVMCPMITNYTPVSGLLFDHVALAFSFLNLGFYDEAYRVFTNSSKLYKTSGDYFTRCAHLCLLLYFKHAIIRALWIMLECIFANFRKSFCLLTFNDFLSRVFRCKKVLSRQLKVSKTLTARSTSPKITSASWKSGLCQQESARKSHNSVSFKVETGVKKTFFGVSTAATIPHNSSNSFSTSECALRFLK